MEGYYYFSLFSGIGGFDLAFKLALQEVLGVLPICVGYSEINKHAIAIYQRHFGGCKNYGDATSIDWQRVEDFSWLFAGFPCQAFSVAGKRLGFKDSRGTLFFEITRALKEKRPRYFLLENVKGLLSHDSGRTFKAVISALTELGYCVEWQVLNSKDFGVPQNRERIYIAGYLGEESRCPIFPIGAERQESPEDEFKEKKIIYAVRSEREIGRIYNPQGIAPTLHRKTGGWQEVKIIFNGMVRRLTPVEYERLQGFPDRWTEGVADSYRYSLLGEAVTINVVKEILKRMIMQRKEM